VDVNEPDPQGDSPVMLAIKMKQPSYVERILQARNFDPKGETKQEYSLAF